MSNSQKKIAHEMKEKMVDLDPYNSIISLEKPVTKQSKDAQKQLKGKLKYHGRVDIKACTEGIAKLRSKAIDELKKYPESMSWNDITKEEFLDAAYRHLMEMMEDGCEAIDPETGLTHLSAVQFNLMVIVMKLEGREY